MSRRFTVVTDATFWYVVDTSLPAEPPCPVAENAVAYYQRHRLGDQMCQVKAGRLCALLNSNEIALRGVGAFKAVYGSKPRNWLQRWLDRMRRSQP